MKLSSTLVHRLVILKLLFDCNLSSQHNTRSLEYVLIINHFFLPRSPKLKIGEMVLDGKMCCLPAANFLKLTPYYMFLGSDHFYAAQENLSVSRVIRLAPGY